MKRDLAIAILRQHEPEFRDAGVGAMYLFGSVARDEARDDSDVDVFFDIGRPDGLTLFDVMGIRERIQDVLHTKVDLVTRGGLHPRRRGRIEADAVRVF